MFTLRLFGDNSQSAALMLAEEIRDQLPTLRFTTNHGKGNFKKQLGRADKHGARIALILGEDEINAGTVAVKDLRSGEQTIVSRSELAPTIDAVIRLRRDLWKFIAPKTNKLMQLNSFKKIMV